METRNFPFSANVKDKSGTMMILNVISQNLISHEINKYLDNLDN